MNIFHALTSPHPNTVCTEFPVTYIKEEPSTCKDVAPTDDEIYDINMVTGSVVKDFPETNKHLESHLMSSKELVCSNCRGHFTQNLDHHKVMVEWQQVFVLSAGKALEGSQNLKAT